MAGWPASSPWATCRPADLRPIELEQDAARTRPEASTAPTGTAGRPRLLRRPTRCGCRSMWPPYGLCLSLCAPRRKRDVTADQPYQHQRGRDVGGRPASPDRRAVALVPSGALHHHPGLAGVCSSERGCVPRGTPPCGKLQRSTTPDHCRAGDAHITTKEQGKWAGADGRVIVLCGLVGVDGGTSSAPALPPKARSLPFHRARRRHRRRPMERIVSRRTREHGAGGRVVGG
jgi:hypothetical protein